MSSYRQLVTEIERGSASDTIDAQIANSRFKAILLRVLGLEPTPAPVVTEASLPGSVSGLPGGQSTPIGVGLIPEDLRTGYAARSLEIRGIFPDGVLVGAPYVNPTTHAVSVYVLNTSEVEVTLNFTVQVTVLKFPVAV